MLPRRSQVHLNCTRALYEVSVQCRSINEYELTNFLVSSWT
jgi:hypothetical protein